MGLVLIAHNVRSAYNIGSLFRTADGLGVEKIYLTGYCPSPADENAPYMTAAQKMLTKTALGAEKSMAWQKISSIGKLLERLKKEEFEIVALEQSEKSISLENFKPKDRIALIVGNEPKGIDARILQSCDFAVEIPMRGAKKSFNVSVAFAIAAYQICSKIKSGN